MPRTSFPVVWLEPDAPAPEKCVDALVFERELREVDRWKRGAAATQCEQFGEILNTMKRIWTVSVWGVALLCGADALAAAPAAGKANMSREAFYRCRGAGG